MPNKQTNNERLAVVETDLRWIKKGLNIVLTRTEFLEKWKWKVSGIAAGVSIVVSGVVVLLKYLAP
jgi:hypothetical protein